MRIALIQEHQNGLYGFHASGVWHETAEVAALQEDMVEQNLALLRQAGEAGADLALTSEAINFPGRPDWHEKSQRELVEPSQRVLEERVSRIAQHFSMNVVVGMLRSEGEKLYNEAVVFDRAGRQVLCYHKQFLAGDEVEYLTPGEGFPVWDSELGRIGIGICWDMQFPETARGYARQGVDLVLAPTWGWESYYAAARAYENGIYVASSMAVPYDKPLDGARRVPSQVIGPDGIVRAQGRLDGSDVVLCEFDPRDCAPSRSLRMGCLEVWEHSRQA